MNKLIILEGMDNTGKTTLGNFLSQKTGLELIHSPGAHQIGNQVYRWMADHFEIETQGRPIIYDRFPLLSEEIYGKVLRGGNLFEHSPEGRFGYSLLQDIDPLIIYCEPPEEQINFWGQRDQMKGVKDNWETLLTSYREFFKSNHLGFSNIIYYDYTQNSFEEMFFKMSCYLISKRDKYSLPEVITCTTLEPLV